MAERDPADTTRKKASGFAQKVVELKKRDRGDMEGRSAWSEYDKPEVAKVSYEAQGPLTLANAGQRLAEYPSRLALKHGVIDYASQETRDKNNAEVAAAHEYANRKAAPGALWVLQNVPGASKAADYMIKAGTKQVNKPEVQTEERNAGEMNLSKAIANAKRVNMTAAPSMAGVVHPGIGPEATRKTEGLPLTDYQKQMAALVASRGLPEGTEIGMAGPGLETYQGPYTEEPGGSVVTTTKGRR